TVPGLANRVGARFARRIAVTFPDGGGHFPAAKIIVTGNPLRPELRGGSPNDAVRRFGLDAVLPLVYVTGGAQGAQRINRAVGAVVLEQAELAPERLLAEIGRLLGDPRRLKDMGARAMTLAVPDADARIVALLIECSRPGTR